MSIRDTIEKKFIEMFFGLWTGKKGDFVDRPDEERNVVILASQVHLPMEVRQHLVLRQYKEIQEAHLLAAIQAVSVLNGDVHIIDPTFVLSVFNAWDDIPDAITLAMRAAANILKNPGFISVCQKIDARIKVGIGIDSGPMLVGTIGNKTRKQVTVFGEPILLARELANHGAGSIFVTQIYYEATSGARLRELELGVEVCTVKQK